MNVLLVSANTETINMPVLPLGLSCIVRVTRMDGHKIKVIKVINTTDRDGLIPEVTRAMGYRMSPKYVPIKRRWHAVD